VPLPEAFGAVFGFWLKDRARGEFVFARATGQKPVSAQAARAYLRGMLQKAGIDKKTGLSLMGCFSTIYRGLLIIFTLYMVAKRKSWN
jgi:hypothetical protein